MKITKNRYLLGFAVAVLLLALIRLIFPGVAEPRDSHEESLSPLQIADTSPQLLFETIKENQAELNRVAKIMAAEKWGVRPVRNREDAEKRMKELVFVGASPYYHVDPLYSSIPYLVPRAAVLLQDIGQAFYDSLYVKGVPFNQLIVTSVLRSESDVEKLRRRNGNATERSCHLYGTTFDICYNRYHPVVQQVRDDTLKWVLCEVLRDMREQGRCYIKYEVKQGCFHMTVR